MRYGHCPTVSTVSRPVTTSSSALAHLEQRVSLLLERLETAGGYSGITNLGRVEEGLQDILRQLERQQAGLAALAEGGPRSTGPAHGQRRRRRDQARTVRDALLPVGNRPSYPGFTRGRQQHARARGRSAGDDRRRPACSPFDACGSGRTVSRRDAGTRTVLPRKPELPNPVLSQMSVPQPARLSRASASIPPRAISEILIPRDTFDPGHDSQSATPLAPQPRAAIDPDLPPDHPLEPGTRPPGRGSPSERIAASESAIGDIAGASREQSSSSSFIAAARRAAQAATAAAPSPDKPGRTRSRDRTGASRHRAHPASPPRSARCWSARAWW